MEQHANATENESDLLSSKQIEQREEQKRGLIEKIRQKAKFSLRALLIIVGASCIGVGAPAASRLQKNREDAQRNFDFAEQYHDLHSLLHAEKYLENNYEGLNAIHVDEARRRNLLLNIAKKDWEFMSGKRPSPRHYSTGGGQTSMSIDRYKEEMNKALELAGATEEEIAAMKSE